MGRLLWLSRWGPCSHGGSTKEKETTQAQRGGALCFEVGEGPQRKECGHLWKLEKARKQIRY